MSFLKSCKAPTDVPSGATNHLYLRFFDVGVHIWSDSTTFSDAVSALHWRALKADSRGAPSRDLVFKLLRLPGSPTGEWLLLLDNETFQLADTELTDAYAYGQLLLMVFRAVRSHILIHAAGVSQGERGVVLLADSMQGKTTLVLELVRRGFKLLSDDTAAFGRQDRRIHPFPRSLFVRPGTLELVGLLPPPEGFLWYNDKLVLDAEALLPECLGEPVPVKHIVLLSNPGIVPTQDAGPHLEVLLARLPAELEVAIRQIEGIDTLARVQENGLPLLRVGARTQADVLGRIEELCRSHNVLVLDYRKHTLVAPDFSGPVTLTPAARTDAVLELLRGFRAGYHSNLFLDGSVSPTQLFFELSTFVADATCHRLQGGPLTETADRICDLVSGGK